MALPGNNEVSARVKRLDCYTRWPRMAMPPTITPRCHSPLGRRRKHDLIRDGLRRSGG